LRCGSAVDQVYDGMFCDRAVIDRVIDRAERMRDSRLVEVTLLILALLIGSAVLCTVDAASGSTRIASDGILLLTR
jgi:hypothetical protein